MHDAVEFLKQVIQVPSVNPPGNERPVAELLKGLLDQHGIETQLVDLGDNRANLVAWLRGADSPDGERRKVLAVSGHMDVVPPGQNAWTHDPFGATVVDGRLYGRGASDMKGGLVGLVFAMIAAKESGVPLHGDVKLLASAGEEVGAYGARLMAESGQMDDVTALVIAEPSDDNLVVAHKGALWVEITTYGKTAHGSTPHLGVNAIAHMNRILQALQSEFQMSYTPDPILGGPTCNIGVIEGGVKTNVVPDRCRVELDIRTVASQRHDTILKELQAVIQNVHQDTPDLRAEIRVLNDLPPIRTEVDDPFVGVVQRAATRVYGSERPIAGMAGYTDGAVLAPVERGVPALIIGGGQIGLAHQPNEYIEIDRYLQAIDLYQAIIVEYLGTP